MKKVIGSILIIYGVMQRLPFFVSNIFVYIALYVLAISIMLYFGHIKLEKNYFSIFLLLWLFYGIISYFWSIDSFLWFRNNMILLVILLSTLIFTNLIDSKENIVFFSKIWALALIVANIVGWYEIIFSNYYFTISPNIANYTYRNRPVFTFFNVNDYSTYLSISIPIILIWIKSSSKKLIKITGYLLVASTLALLYLSFSRGNILAIVLGFIFLILTSNIKLKRTNLSLAKLSFIISFFGLIILYSNGYLDEVLFKFIYNRSSSDSLRMDLIKNGFVYLKNSNYMGVGSGNVEYWLENYHYYNTSGIVYIHHWWVEVLVNFGIFIFIGYVIFWIKILISNYRMAIQNRDQITKYLSMAVIVFSFAVISPSSILLMKWLPVFTGFIVGSTLYLQKTQISMEEQ